ncbi:MAG: DUF3857 domain-containing protein, partial [Bacteroidota bacterium]
YEDNRVLYFKPHINQLPYTVEYEYTTRSDAYMTFPSWIPVPAHNVSTCKSDYTLNIPSGFNVRIKEFNLPEKHITEEEGDSKKIIFRLRDYEALEEEPHSPGADSYLPFARLIPRDFQLDKYPGSFESWQAFGEWVNILLEGRDVLPEEAIVKIKKQVEGLDTDREKVKALYEYLQSTTRYISIQLGIGGFQPFSADYVYSNGYGDCKALTNYMRSMLKVAGIESYYSLVKAGNSKTEIFRDFPSQQFNHVILCVPFEKDTLWLECTSQTNPPGYLGFFTDDRYALLIDADKSHLVRTKSYTIVENLQNRKATVEIDPETMMLTANVQTRYHGKQFETVNDLVNKSKEDQKKDLMKKIDIPDFNVYGFDIEKSHPGVNPEGLINLDLQIERYISKSGDRFFLPLNLMNKTSYIPPKLKERKNDLYLGYNYCDTDTIIYTLPEEYMVEYMPESISTEYPFGSYSVDIYEENNKLVFVRQRSMKKGIYDKELYESLREYYETVRKGDQLKALLKKIT